MTKNILKSCPDRWKKKNSFKRNTCDVWLNYGFFKHQPCGFGVEEENILENSLLYLNRGYQSYKDNKKVYYGDFFVCQVNEALNPPEDLSTYNFKEREVQIYRPRYDPVKGTFRGLYETFGYIMVRGDADEHFLDISYSKKDSKILHSFHRKACLTVFWELFSIVTVFNTNLVRSKLIFQRLFTFFHP